MTTLCRLLGVVVQSCAQLAVRRQHGGWADAKGLAMHEVHAVSPMGTWFPSHSHLEATKPDPGKIWGIAAASANQALQRWALHTLCLCQILNWSICKPLRCMIQPAQTCLNSSSWPTLFPSLPPLTHLPPHLTDGLRASAALPCFMVLMGNHTHAQTTLLQPMFYLKAARQTMGKRIGLSFPNCRLQGQKGLLTQSKETGKRRPSIPWFCISWSPLLSRHLRGLQSLQTYGTASLSSRTRSSLAKIPHQSPLLEPCCFQDMLLSLHQPLQWAIEVSWLARIWLAEPSHSAALHGVKRAQKNRGLTNSSCDLSLKMNCSP